MLVFGGFELQPERRRLLQGGNPVALGARAFDVLLALAERCDRIVTKAELLDLVWPGLVVEENNLQVQISTLRKLLGPGAISTIPGRGYRFVASADVEREAHTGEGLIPIERVEVFGLTADAAFTPPEDTEKAHRVVRGDDGWQPAREVRHNLPCERDAFVGRAADLAAVAGRFGSGARLLTVFGPAGTGKTRLAGRYGRQWLGDWPGGVYFCDLSEARTPDGVFLVVALALDVPLGKADSGVQLGHAIATRGRCLLILDNFEQIVAHAEASVGRWLDRAPDAAFLVTSRERLHLAGEDVLALEPLAADGEGVELFVLRARAQRPDVALTPAHQPVLCRIVALLDGLPLAIELAAARMRVLSPAQLLERLSDRFTVLAGARSAADRQATLKSAIDWSWNLLVPWEQAALAQCSVFVGGFTLDAAEAVLDVSKFADAPPIVDVVQTLVDKSLLRMWVPSEQARHDIEDPYFGMYLTIHDYAAKKLATSDSDVRHAAEERHGAHFARFGSDDAVCALHRHGGVARRRALMLELDNFVIACRRAVVLGDGETAVSTLRAVWEAIETQGPFELAIELGARVDALADLAPSSRAAALTAVGRAHIAAGRLEQASALLERALEMARVANDVGREAEVLPRLASAERHQGRMDAARGHAERALALRSGRDEDDGDALLQLGVVQHQTGAMADARETYEHALAIDRAVGDVNSESAVLGNLAIVHAEQGRLDDARAHFERALALCEEIGDRRGAALVLGNLAMLNVGEGHVELGRSQFESALAIHRDTGERIEEGIRLMNLANMDRSLGRFDEARRELVTALAIAREVGNPRIEGVVLESLGTLEHDEGNSDLALARYEEALALHRAVDNPHSQGTVLCRLGELHLGEGRLDDARALFAQAEAGLRAIDARRNIVELLCLRIKLELACGDRSKAQAMLDEATRDAEAMRLDPQAQEWTDIAALRAGLESGQDADAK